MRPLPRLLEDANLLYVCYVCWDINQHLKCFIPQEDRLSFLEEQLDSILNGPGYHRLTILFKS
jgi:hypothetical protein